MKEEAKKGHITIEKTVWCGACAEWESHCDYFFRDSIRRNGWRRTKQLGWLCRKCFKTYNES